jgi:hypothetical protein
MATALSVSGFLVCLIVIAAVRAFSNQRFEIKSSDAITAVMPVLVWLIAAGKINLQFERDGIQVTQAIKSAYSGLAPQAVGVADLPVDKVVGAARQNTLPLPEVKVRVDLLLKNRVQVLMFTMGSGHQGEVIDFYFRTLITHPSFRFFLINSQDGKYFGVIPAQSVRDLLSQEGADDSRKGALAAQFAGFLNNSDKAGIRAIPGFSDASVDANADKLTALRELNKENVAFLPVVENGQFDNGIVDRQRLVTSVLVDIYDGLGTK